MIAVRPLRWCDAWFCWRVARDPLVRAMSADPTPPTPCGHLRWMRRRIAGPAAGWIVTHGPTGTLLGPVPLGVAQAARRDGRLWLGIALARRWRGFGLAAPAILAATVAALARWPNEYEVWAEIKRENAASRRAFGRAGYLPAGRGRESFGTEWRVCQRAGMAGRVA